MHLKPRHSLLLPFLLLISALSACASLGLATPQNLEQRLAYGYSTYTAVQQAAANSTNAGELSSADAEAVLKLADQSRMLLDGSKALLATDPDGAATKLELATAILVQLQTYLRSKK